MGFIQAKRYAKPKGAESLLPEHRSDFFDQLCDESVQDDSRKTELVDDCRDGETLRLDDQVCFALYAATHAFSRRYKPHLDRLGVTYPQYLCLLVLWEKDGLTVKAIGDRLSLDSGTLTPLLKRLESAGFVARRRDRVDERQVRIQLTEAGRALHDRALPIRALMACASGRPPEELAVLRDDLFRLRDALCATS
jgi:MarR family transcriptional regulator, organic hydroperoxide resistance regulator